MHRLDLWLSARLAQVSVYVVAPVGVLLPPRSAVVMEEVAVFVWAEAVEDFLGHWDQGDGSFASDGLGARDRPKAIDDMIDAGVTDLTDAGTREQAKSKYRS